MTSESEGFEHRRVMRRRLIVTLSAVGVLLALIVAFNLFKNYMIRQAMSRSCTRSRRLPIFPRRCTRGTKCSSKPRQSARRSSMPMRQT